MTRSGYLYVLVNPSLPGLVKIGQTERQPEDRVRELSGAAGVPTPFILVFDAYFDDVRAAESHTHALLEARGARLSPTREFFQIPPSVAIRAVISMEDYFAKRVDRSTDAAVQRAATSSDLTSDDHRRRMSSAQASDILAAADAACHGLGDALMDRHRGLALYTQAAKLGSPRACREVARLQAERHSCGIGCRARDRSFQQLVEWLREGMTRGDTLSAAWLGELFDTHYGQLANATKCWARYFSDVTSSDLSSPDRRQHIAVHYGYCVNFFISWRESYGTSTPDHAEHISRLRDDLVAYGEGISNQTTRPDWAWHAFGALPEEHEHTITWLREL